MDDLVRTENLIARKNGPAGEIIFNNPAKLNAVSLDMWQRLDDVLAEYEQDPDIRVLVLSGAGEKAFVSGADISKFESERATKEAVEAYGATSKAASNRLYDFPRPTIAKIRGYCIGGGVGLAVCCDIRICGERSRFAIPAAKLGVGYGFAGVKRLADIIGTSRAMEIFYTARQFTAVEAYEMGLVNRVLPENILDAYVAGYTAMIAENAPMTIATIKAVAREISKPSAERDLDKLEAMVADCFDSEDYVEGRRAFMEKRKPNFTGA
ncbi:short-chain-enoyl-CoA hydratase [bacterium MnTg02]|nr:short-chain-enoyl-CoA hydratase [bacterium MnTg02]